MILGHLLAKLIISCDGFQFLHQELEEADPETTDFYGSVSQTSAGRQIPWALVKNADTNWVGLGWGLGVCISKRLPTLLV